MLPLHILPVGEKLRDNARNMEKEEERYHVIKRQNPDCDDVQAAVQEVCMITARYLLKRWIRYSGTVTDNISKSIVSYRFS